MLFAALGKVHLHELQMSVCSMMQPLSTRHSQEEKECILQDMNRVYAFCAFAFSCFIAQLSFVLKKWLCRDAVMWLGPGQQE